MARKRRLPQEINAGSMADIAFLLLIFFLVTTQMNADKGLLRKLPPIVEEENQDNIKIKERNVFVVLVNANDQLLVEGKLMDVKNLRHETKEFIIPSCGDELQPECKDTVLSVPGVGQRKVILTKQVVSLQNDNGTSYDMYLRVQNELIAAYNELRNELAEEWYGKIFDKLTDDQASPIKVVYPQNISEAEPKQVGGPQ
ncbi:MAG: biopolymer transporter ExbD [Flavobacteriales bacterium]|nr:biopolymer transporter ExbD [Flavobacteriales bacterium]